ncbi:MULTISPECIES: hypothetical protein [Thermoprotei]
MPSAILIYTMLTLETLLSSYHATGLTGLTASAITLLEVIESKPTSKK